MNACSCTLYAYTEIEHTTATVLHPQTEADLATIFRELPSGRNITFRAGGHSFDGQSLGKDIVVRMGLSGPGCPSSFSRIGEPQLDDDGFFITTGAGARWWDVVCKTSEFGLMPPSIATAGGATVGGTLSADCLSRMSPIAGKEGDHIRSFTIVLADGRILPCQRNDRDPERRELFRSVIGGFGYLGAVTEVTFDLMVARDLPGTSGARPRVLTRATRYSPSVDWDDVLRRLQYKTVAARRHFRSRHRRFQREDAPGAAAHGMPLALAPEWSALSIASFFTGSGMGANLLEQRYVPCEVPLNPSPGGTYDKDSTLTATAQPIAVRWPTFVELALDFGFPEGTYVDELFGWVFFVGNSCERAKASEWKHGRRLNIIQQTWLLPVGDPNHIDTRPTQRFIELLEARVHAADLRPTEVDFLYIPGDDILMSASRNLPAFAVTSAFAQSDAKVIDPALDDLFRALSRDCRSLGGRVHLVKNVIADAADLRAMHGDAAAELRKLKARYDPRGVFRNAFFDRVFDA